MMDARPPVPRAELAWILLLLFSFAFHLILVSRRTGVTIDEPAHLLSANLYWQGKDTLDPGDMPPAIKIVGGWVPAFFFMLPIPYDRPDIMAVNHEWDISLAMMDRLKNRRDIERLFFYSRLPLIVFPLGCCLLLWWWGRQLFSPTAGLLMALAFSLSPSVLGHGYLFKNDLAASLSFLLFWWRCWAFWRNPRLVNSAWLGAALLFALMSKFSLYVLLPLAPAIVLARYLTLRPVPRKRIAAALALVLVIPYAGIVASWQFKVNRPSAQELSAISGDPAVPSALSAAFRSLRWLPTPPRIRNGIVSLLRSNATDGSVYFRGQILPGGHPLYFLTALALKIPTVLLLLIVTGFGLAISAHLNRLRPATDLFWLLPPLIYLTLASFSSLQMGVRLVLPTRAFLVMFTGFTLEWLRRRRAFPIVAPLLFLWLSVRVLPQFPHYISFFNMWAGGPDNGLSWLSDSNLDWGQDLPELARWMGSRPNEQLRLAYFGTDNPFAYIPDTRMELLAPPWSAELVHGQTRLQPGPGLYAISATLLTGHLFAPEFRDYFTFFRQRRPIAKAGYSIFIFQIDPSP